MDKKAPFSDKNDPPTRNQNFVADGHASCSSTKSVSPKEFVNHGLILWTETRQQWVSTRKLPQNRSTQDKGPKLSRDEIYNSLLCWAKPLPRPVPLSEMVDFLAEIWEEDGLFETLC